MLAASRAQRGGDADDPAGGTAGQMSTAAGRRAAVDAGATLAVAVLALGSASASAAAPKPSPRVAAALASVVRQTAALPSVAVTPSKRARLLRHAHHARSTARRRPCVAVGDLSSYRRSVRSAKLPAGLGRSRRTALRRRLAALGTSSMAASRRLLADRRTRRCGGGVTPSDLTSTKTSVLRSDENGMRVRVRLPQLRFVPQTDGDLAWTKLVLPDTDAPGAPGTPGIPVASSVIGVPAGAKLGVKAARTTSITIDGVDVYPIQPEPVDQAPPPVVTLPPDFLEPPFAAKPFTFDPKAYRKKGLTPAASARGALLGRVRDLQIGTLQVPAARYDPTTDRLEVLTSVDVDVTFGGAKTFSDQIGSPWETPQNRVVAALLNADFIKKVTKRPIVVQPCGEEMLVITNPATRSAADTFADARRAAGLRTSVRETGAGAGRIGSSAGEIQTFVRSRLTAPSCIHPSYVTIVGDDDLVPTFPAIHGIPSDLPYSMRDDGDELPDVAVGRIVADDLAQADAAVAKIVAYETTPPTGAMLTRALLAGQFQDTDGAGEANDGREDRTFIQFSETVRTGLIGRGVSVDRVYQDDPPTNPLKFSDGTDLPVSLRKPTFAWHGDAADVSAAWNAGRFMVVHRAHGWPDGWGDLLFTTEDVDALTNGANLPVLFSIDCASAAYDLDDTSLAQSALVKSGGGAVGVFGDTRNSPSWHNSQIALGFIDGLLPNVLPGEGPVMKQRTGDALVNGKLRLAGLAPPAADGDTRDELYLWHYFGDPSMQMWGGGAPPIVLDPVAFEATYKQLPPPTPGDPPPFLVEVTLPPALVGQPFSLLRDGEVIGKAIAGEGTVQVPATFNDGEPRPGDLTVAVEPDGAAPVRFGVDGVPPAPTTLTQTCPSPVALNDQTPATVSVTGTLAGAPASSTVVVTFTRPTRVVGSAQVAPTETVVATTDAQGAWTASVTTSDRQDLGTWTVSSSYAGTSRLAASQAGPCSTSVQLG
jgi:hypothetical protein